MSSTSPYRIFPPALAACLIAILLLTAGWIWLEIAWYHPFLWPEAWWNVWNYGVAGFKLSLKTTLPPWLLLLVLVRLATRFNVAHRLIAQFGYGQAIAIAYVAMAIAVALAWSATSGFSAISVAIYFLCSVLPGVLLAAWWVLRKAIARRAPQSKVIPS